MLMYSKMHDGENAIQSEEKLTERLENQTLLLVISKLVNYYY